MGLSLKRGGGSIQKSLTISASKKKEKEKLATGRRELPKQKLCKWDNKFEVPLLQRPLVSVKPAFRA